jgi:hypothetical protein
MVTRHTQEQIEKGRKRRVRQSSFTSNDFFCKVLYSVSVVPERYIKESKVFLILAVNFYYIINKLIILVPDTH